MTHTSLEKRQRIEVLDLQYDSVKGGRVTGFLVQPRRTGRFAGVVFGHWGQGNRTEFLPEAIRYAEAGAVCVLIDYPWVRPAPWRKEIYTSQTTAEEDRDLLAQAVIDLRRAIDILIARPDVDQKRIAYVGHSNGAQFGAMLSAVDKRLATAILIGGTPTAATIYLESQEPEYVQLRNTAGLDAVKKLVQTIGVLDGIHFVPFAAPTSLLFQFARYERFFNEVHMRSYFNAASNPKKMLWYSTGHDLNDPAALADRAKWLQEKIALSVTRTVLSPVRQ